MGNRDRYENRGSYERPERERQDDGMLKRIKDDVKGWFESDDERHERSGRNYRRGYEASDYGGNQHQRNQERHRDTWRGSSSYGGEQTYGAQGYGDRHYGDRSSGRYGLRDRDFSEADYGDRSYGSTGYGERSARSRDDEDDYDTRYSSSRRQPRVLSGEYWATPGPHAGIGPKGFQRSPDSLKERVCERLEQAGYIDASDIEVEVENDEVTLSGSVPDREQKRLAEDCAESVRGVSDVHNRLTLRRGTGSSGGVATGPNTGKTSGSNPSAKNS